MLKHSYLSPTKQRTKSQSSENSEIDDDRGICCSSTTTIATISTLKSCQSDDDDIKTSARPLRTKVSRRRPPSGAESAVRRWNSFHSTRGECHPNKFRRERKSISPSIDLGRRSIIGGGSATRSWELRRGKSLAEKSSLGASSLSAAKEHRAASIW